MNPKSHDLQGLPIHAVRHEEATKTLLQWATTSGPAKTVVTINPEIFVQASTDVALRQAVHEAGQVTVDGVGVYWAAKLRGIPLPERVLGIELIQSLMAAGGANLRVYFYGAAPGVAEKAAQICQQKYGIQVAGIRDGYSQATPEHILQDMQDRQANLVLTALGCPLQETFNERARQHLQNCVLIGVGGSLDVIAGHAPRAPKIYSTLGLEFLWRIVKLRRWKRSVRLLQFVGFVLKNGRVSPVR